MNHGAATVAAATNEAAIAAAERIGDELRMQYILGRLGISLNRLNEIVLGKRGITADTALRLAQLLKTSPQLWMRLQADWDLHEAIQRQARRAS